MAVYGEMPICGALPSVVGMSCCGGGGGGSWCGGSWLCASGVLLPDGESGTGWDTACAETVAVGTVGGLSWGSSCGGVVVACGSCCCVEAGCIAGLRVRW